MLTKWILQILVLAATWVGWDLFAKESFITWISGGADNPTVIEVGLAFLPPFLLSFALYTALKKVLRVDEQPREGEYYG